MISALKFCWDLLPFMWFLWFFDLVVNMLMCSLYISAYLFIIDILFLK